MDGIELIITTKLDMYHKSMYQIQNFQQTHQEVMLIEQFQLIQNQVKKQQKKIQERLQHQVQKEKKL